MAGITSSEPFIEKVGSELSQVPSYEMRAASQELAVGFKVLKRLFRQGARRMVGCKILQVNRTEVAAQELQSEHPVRDNKSLEDRRYRRRSFE
jgi:hypothetical protein